MDTLSHLTELIADSVFHEFNKDRFGLDNCKLTIDPLKGLELQTIYKRELEKVSCGNVPTTCLSCCSMSTIEEKINTL